MLQWSLSGHQHVCISKSEEVVTQTNKKKTLNGRRSQFNRYWSYKPHSNFKPTWNFLKILYMSFKWYFWQKWKILMSVLGLNSKDRRSTRDKANMSNPKVNRGFAPLTANRTSADCVQISLGPSIPYIPLRVCHTGGFNAMNWNPVAPISVDILKPSIDWYYWPFVREIHRSLVDSLHNGPILWRFGVFTIYPSYADCSYGWAAQPCQHCDC